MPAYWLWHVVPVIAERLFNATDVPLAADQAVTLT
jgi:hypothetical protein